MFFDTALLYFHILGHTGCSQLPSKATASNGDDGVIWLEGLGFQYLAKGQHLKIGVFIRFF